MNMTRPLSSTCHIKRKEPQPKLTSKFRASFYSSLPTLFTVHLFMILPNLGICNRFYNWFSTLRKYYALQNRSLPLPPSSPETSPLMHTPAWQTTTANHLNQPPFLLFSLTSSPPYPQPPPPKKITSLFPSPTPRSSTTTITNKHDAGEALYHVFHNINK